MKYPIRVRKTAPSLLSRSWPRSQCYHLIQNKIQLENANHILVYIKINVVNLLREVIFHLYSTLRPHLLCRAQN